MYIKLLACLAMWMVGFWLYGVTLDRMRRLFNPRMENDPDEPQTYKPKPWWRKMLQAVSRRWQR